MNWFMSLIRGGMVKTGLQQQNRNWIGRGTIVSLLAIAGGAVAYGVARRRNGGGNLIQQSTRPLRNRSFR